ncbi:MAG: LexA repressor [Candidatus Tokpelaia sp. JSC189]|nr:MAG: LexA repressor [Candidatus Tokpelaia sp. JSC189]
MHNRHNFIETKQPANTKEIVNINILVMGRIAADVLISAIQKQTGGLHIVQYLADLYTKKG